MRTKSFPRRSIRQLWRYSLLITGPIAVVFALWALGTASRYYQFGMRFGGNIGRYNLHQAGTYEWDRFRNGVRTAVFEKSPAEERKLKQVHLMINEGDLGKLDRHLPASGKDYMDGYLQYPDGELTKVDVRYRGDFPWHWATPKKSWRIKTTRDSLWNGMRAFNLIVPKGQAVVEDCLGYWLALEMGLIAPQAELVEGIINGKTCGIYMLIEQVEEMTLRKNDRMPGDIFAGELIGTDEIVGLPPNVFLLPGSWQKVAENNHFADPAISDVSIRRLCALLAEEPSQENSAELLSLVDVEAMGRFAAFRLLTQTEHFDRVHNWRLYYDPWRNRFEPVIWDAVPWHQNWMPKANEDPFLDVMFCELDDRLNMEHSYRTAIGQTLRHFFDSGLRERVLEQYDQYVDSIQDAQRRDPVLNFQMAYVAPETVASYQVTCRREMQRVFRFLEEKYCTELPLMSVADMGGELGQPNWRVALHGRRGIDGLRIEFNQDLAVMPRVGIGYDTPEGRVLKDVSGSCVLRGRSLDVEVPLLGGLRLIPNPPPQTYPNRGTIELQTASFDVFVSGTDSQGTKAQRIAAIVDEGRIVHMPEVDALLPYPLEQQFSVVQGEPYREPRVYQGEMRIAGIETIQNPVVIRAGTKLRMEPGAVLIFEGPVVAEGTAKEPIEIVPADEGQEPWGTFALRGAGANGSVLRHIHMVGGSGYKVPLAEYSSMLSLHTVKDVLVQDCLLEDSKIVDDMVHGVYSKVVFERCHFVRSLFDSLDMDISEVEVRDCIFESSGNDSMDLMTTLAIVENTQFLKSGDKGISIGENSTLFARNCLFDACQIGLQSKDESQAAVVNSDIVRCVWGVDAYKKNWRYNGGAEIYLYKSRLSNNQEALRADKNSVVGVADCYVDTWATLSHPRILGGAGMQSMDTHKAAVPVKAAYRFKREQQELSELGSQIWGRVRLEVRGSTFLQNP